VTGVVFDLLLLAVVLVAIVALPLAFGHPAVEGRHSLCPGCGARGGLQPIGVRQYGLDSYRCERCGACYDEQLDGSLVRMPSTPPTSS
jgi:hypothetical protein